MRVFVAGGSGVLGRRLVPQLVARGRVVEPHTVNGQPGAIVRDRDGRVVGTLALDVLGGRIQTIRSVLNPDKLGHLGPVADAWTVVRETTAQARRPAEQSDRPPDRAGGRPL
ncbi:hypothetical protein GCM10009663_54630 [Kitasatospora arboriphila]|uniref:NAD-dependent epimerase/dehydratase family protein n=1 Tax=Kitasatospora arboriphila TaxID=258052 RepID=A0ABP4EED0_9ACTN